MTFLQNILADLRDKRLWPVAIALLVGIVAVPTVLARKSSEEGAAPGPAVPAVGASAAGAPAGEVAIALDVSAPGARDRKGEVRNPFEQLFVPKPEVVGGAPLESGDAKGGGADGAPAGDDAQDGSSGKPPAAEPKAKTTTFYELSLRFGQAGSMRTIDDIARLTPLPSANDPFFVFLGVKDDGRTAVFLVSSDAKATGDGVCKPSDSDCQTIELKAGDTEFFDLTTESGVQQYQMDIVSLVKKTASTNAAASRAHARASAIGAGMLEEARKAGDMPAQLGWYRWDAASGVLVPVTANALRG